jgi:RNA polymerase sigma-70 factor (ECF subfamily)
MGTCAIAAANAATETSQAVPSVDAGMVSRAKDGDRDAFATLFDLHKRKVYSLCLRMTGDVVEAEDLTQDVFIQVFRKIATFRGDSSFSTWLYRVAVNTVLMELRKKHPRQVSLDEPVQLDSSCVQRDLGRSDLDLEGSVDRIALNRAIQELPEGCRRIFLLHEVEGYEHHEIAKLLRCSVGNSKSQLHKARLKMQDMLFPQHEFVSKRAEPKKAKSKSLGEASPAATSSDLGLAA